MQPLTEPTSPHQIGRLDEAWALRDSLLLLPTINPVTRDWITQALSALSDDLRHDHFGLLTSGSTGTPKLVIGSKTRALDLARQIHKRQQLDGVGAAVLTLPLSYSYSFVNQWLWARSHGAKLLVTRGLSEPRELIACLTSLETDAMLCLVGAQVPLLRQSLTPGQCFPAVTRLNFAGGAFPQHELEWLGTVFPNAVVFNNYGCTEALPRLCIREAGESPDPTNIGRPLDGVELRCNDDSSLEFRSRYGAVAMVTAKGLERIDASQWLPTGDLGSQDESGQWRLLGRSSEVFKRFGEKVSLPALLDTVRGAWSGDAAFYIDRQQTGGETAHILVLSPAPDPAQLRNVLMSFRARHRRPHWPVRIETAESIPLLPNGKPDGRALALKAGEAVVWKQFG